MCNLFLFHLHQDHFHWFKFPVRFNGKIKHGWRIPTTIDLYKHSRSRSHMLTNENKLFYELDSVQLAMRCVYLFILYEFRERTDAHCITHTSISISIYLFTTSTTSLVCFVVYIENFMQNKQTVLKNFREIFLWLNLFFLGMHVVSNKRKWR